MKHFFAAAAMCTIISSAFAGASMKIQINGTEYQVQTNDNETATGIVAHAPLELDLARYAEHEYTATLPFTPRDSDTHTSHLLPGHVYWWGAGNAFVINFVDTDISPYKSVHIGEIVDSHIIDELQKAPDRLLIKITK